MTRTTIYLSRLTGLFTIIFVLGVFANRELAEMLFADRTLLLALAMLAVVAGLAMVLSHNLWSGGVQTIIVTIVGWLVLVKGATLLILPADAMMSLFDTLRVQERLGFFLIVPFLLGLYLTVSGFKTRMP